MHKVKLSNIAQFVFGQSPKSKYYSKHDGIPFLQGNKTFGFRYPKIDMYSTKVTRIAPKNSILMSVRAPVGDLNLAQTDFCIGRGLMSISANDNDNESLYYILKYNIPNLLALGNGTTYDSITKNVINNFDLIIPSLSYSDILKILNLLDHKIELNDKINSELESLAKMLYDYWFVQFNFPDEFGRPYKSSGGKMMYNEILKREIPSGWEVKKLGETIIEHEKSSIQVNQSTLIGKYPFFTSGNDILKCNNFLVDGMNCYLNTGGNASVKYYYGKASYSTDTWCISGNSYSFYLFNYLNSIMNQINKLFFAGTSLKHLQKDAFKKSYIVLPPNKIIAQFNNSIAFFYKKNSDIYIENENLSNLRDFLLPLLMNGQVSVNP